MNTTNYLIVIEQEGNISKAAEKLGISQPALSSHIKKLEEKLGFTIFDRSVKPMGFTESGHLYLSYIKKEEALEKEFYEQLTDMDQLKRGSLVLGGASFFNVSYFPKAIAKFAKQYPQIEIKVIDGNLSDITQMAKNYGIDLFIAPPWNMDPQCEYEKVCSEKIFLCVPESFEINEELKEYRIPHDVVVFGETDLWIQIKKDKARVDFSVFKDQQFIKLGENQHIGSIMASLFERHGFQPKGCISVEQTMTSYGLTLADVGISLITEGSLKGSHIQNYPALYLIDEDLGQRDMYVAYPKERYLKKAAKEFINILKKSL